MNRIDPTSSHLTRHRLRRGRWRMRARNVGIWLGLLGLGAMGLWIWSWSTRPSTVDAVAYFDRPLPLVPGAPITWSDGVASPDRPLGRLEELIPAPEHDWLEVLSPVPGTASLVVVSHAAPLESPLRLRHFALQTAPPQLQLELDPTATGQEVSDLAGAQVQVELACHRTERAQLAPIESTPLFRVQINLWENALEGGSHCLTPLLVQKVASTQQFSLERPRFDGTVVHLGLRRDPNALTSDAATPFVVVRLGDLQSNDRETVVFRAQPEASPPGPRWIARVPYADRRLSPVRSDNGILELLPPTRLARVAVPSQALPGDSTGLRSLTVCRTESASNAAPASSAPLSLWVVASKPEQTDGARPCWNVTEGKEPSVLEGDGQTLWLQLTRPHLPLIRATLTLQPESLGWTERSERLGWTERSERLGWTERSPGTGVADPASAPQHVRLAPAGRVLRVSSAFSLKPGALHLDAHPVWLQIGSREPDGRVQLQASSDYVESLEELWSQLVEPPSHLPGVPRSRIDALVRQTPEVLAELLERLVELERLAARVEDAVGRVDPARVQTGIARGERLLTTLETLSTRSLQILEPLTPQTTQETAELVTRLQKLLRRLEPLAEVLAAQDVAALEQGPALVREVHGALQVTTDSLSVLGPVLEQTLALERTLQAYTEQARPEDVSATLRALLEQTRRVLAETEVLEYRLNRTRWLRNKPRPPIGPGED